ncbi:MAG: hypothetical protein HKL81_04460 [Acidimicrobiaceae bacterium]|nr:hypothetical protein [Acidimicrobiaceae bacterium]
MDVRLRASQVAHGRGYFGIHFTKTIVRSGIIWGFVFFAFVASSALSYLSIYSSVPQREALAKAFGSNLATIALFGPAPSLNTVMGFTQFKSFLSVSVIGAVWGFLTTTKAIKGEEESLRWELVLSMPTTSRRTTWSVFRVVLTGIFAMWITMSLSMAALSLDSKLGLSFLRALFFATASIAAPIVFASFALFSSQMTVTRRQASSWCGWLLAAGYILRMLADAKVGANWLIWVSPLGWVEKLAPLGAPDPVAFVPILLFSAVAIIFALYMAKVRDVGSGFFTPRGRKRSARSEKNFGHLGLGVRLFGSFVLAWLLAVAFTGFAIGMVADGAGSTMAGSSIEDVFSRLGAKGANARGFLGVASLILGVMIEVFSASLVKETYEEEGTLRVEHFLLRRYRRGRWIWERFALYVAALALASLVAGSALFIGASIGGAGLAMSTLLAAGVNLLPGGVFIQGIAMAAFGLVGSWATKAAYLVLGWSVLLELLGGISPINHWVMDSSILHQMSPAPASAVDWTSAAILVVVSLGLVALGGYSFNSRDLGVESHSVSWESLRAKVKVFGSEAL